MLYVKYNILDSKRTMTNILLTIKTIPLTIYYSSCNMLNSQCDIVNVPLDFEHIRRAGGASGAELLWLTQQITGLRPRSHRCPPASRARSAPPPAGWRGRVYLQPHLRLAVV